MYFLQEKYTHGTLARILRKCKGQLSLDFCRYTLYCIVRGVYEVHKLSHALGELTPDRIMLDEKFHVKIGSLEGLR